jgi:hypothetical protein
VAAGGYHSLGLKSDSSIVAWGYNGTGQCNVPPPNADFVAVASGAEHSLGLKACGSIVAWGANANGQCDVPPPNDSFVAVAGGDYHSLGLKSDGSIAAWGENWHGQCDVPLPNYGFVAIAGGDYHSLGLRDNGSIAVWGLCNSDRCDVPAPNEDFVAVAGGGSHNLGLKSNGSIVAWGETDVGQCDVPTQNVNFVAVAAGQDHSLGIRGNPLTKIHIADFAAVYSRGRVRLRWNLRGTRHIVGFDIYRSRDAKDHFQIIDSIFSFPERAGAYVDEDIEPGQTYWYRLGGVDDEDTWFSRTVSVTVPKDGISLAQSFPNPFNPTTTISFVLPAKAHVTLSIYNVDGKLINTLADESLPDGLNEIKWDGRDSNGYRVSSGVYLYRLKVGKKTLTKKMLLVK